MNCIQIQIQFNVFPRDEKKKRNFFCVIFIIAIRNKSFVLNRSKHTHTRTGLVGIEIRADYRNVSDPLQTFVDGK